jgi:kynurenine formamidase
VEVLLLDKLIDLTRTIKDLMPVYPGDDETRLFQTRQLEEDKYNNHKLETGMHAGTHIDGPMHLIKINKYISQLPLENFIGNGCILDGRETNIITYKKEYEDKIKLNDIVLICTGQASKYSTSAYYTDYPVIDNSLAELLVKKKIKILGVDSPSPDNYPFNIHKLLLGNGIMIIENLMNLEKLLNWDRFEIIALPLKIEADSSILRVVARITG